MQKRLILALIIFQAILTFLHWLLYKLVVKSFPFLPLNHSFILAVIMALSVAFLVFAALSHFLNTFLLRLAYIFSSVWLVLAFYLFVFLALAQVVSRAAGQTIPALNLIATAASFLLVLYGLINARIIRLTTVNIKLPASAEEWKGKAAVLVSDLHLGQILTTKFARKIVKVINEQKPQIVFIPGDFYDGVDSNFPLLAEAFKNLKAPWGTFFCSGNHEMYAGYEACEQAIKNAGIEILEDKKVEVKGVQIVGLAYKHETASSTAERLNNLNLNPDKPAILLKHVPSHLHSAEKAGVTLQLSGHTHLGQIWPFRYLTKRLFNGYDSGLKTFGRMQIYTSSGVGTWGPPMRTFTKSEIIKINFI